MVITSFNLFRPAFVVSSCWSLAILPAVLSHQSSPTQSIEAPSFTQSSSKTLYESFNSHIWFQSVWFVFFIDQIFLVSTCGLPLLAPATVKCYQPHTFQIFLWHGHNTYKTGKKSSIFIWNVGRVKTQTRIPDKMYHKILPKS